MYVVVWRRDVVAGYLHDVGPSGGDDLGVVTTLIVGGSDRRHGVCGGGDVGMRRGWCGEWVRWGGI